MIMGFTGMDINLPFAIGITVLWNVLLWLVSPWISDLIYRWLYKVEWIGIEWIEQKSPESAKIIRSVCEQYGISMPKLGVIPDNNPNAFTYGSGKWNSRIIVTEGIFKYLDENERPTVYAHELGHIRNNDFIIMTIASTLLQIIYEIYYFSKEMSKRKSSNSKKWNPFALVMIVAYLFYIVGNYALLYLSRIREYFADEFSAKHTDANALAQALIKIALGILATPENNRLVESTRHIGIASAAMSEGIGLIYANCEKAGNFEPLAKAFLFDLKSPWAWISELTSTHPLTGKRIKALMKFTDKPYYDLEKIETQYPVDTSRLYGGFWRDVFLLGLVKLLPIIGLVGGIIIGLGSAYPDAVWAFIISWFILGIGLGLLINTYMRYGDTLDNPTTVLDTMGDMYTSPVRGKRVSLEGTIIWKGIPGYVFSEDMMFQDKTGLIYLDYQSKIPLIGNLIFSLTKVKALIDTSVKATGWFFRGVSSNIVIDELTGWTDVVKWWAKFWGMIGGLICTWIGVVGIFLSLTGKLL
jgi:Zn-dependent protease with chaperone function